MPTEQQYYALNDLDRKLERFLNYDNGFFIELGANNGISQSNTLYFEKYRNWRGILIEPVLHNYFHCKKVRSPENTYFCNACVSFDYKNEFVPILYANLMTTALTLESDIERPVKHVASGRKYLQANEEVVIFGARAKTLHEILLEARAPKVIDLLSLDVEGAEIEVLKGVDFAMFQFKYICVECRDIDTMSSFLYPYGYHMIEALSAHDYLFAL